MIRMRGGGGGGWGVGGGGGVWGGVCGGGGWIERLGRLRRLYQGIFPAETRKALGRRRARRCVMFAGAIAMRA